MDPYKSDSVPSGDQLKYTGKRLLMLDETAGYKKISEQASDVSLRLAFSSDYKSHEEDYVKAFSEADGIVFDRFGVAVVNQDHDEQINVLTAAKKSFRYSEPERYVYALGDGGSPAIRFTPAFLWKLICRIFGIKPNKPSPELPVDNPVFEDDAQAFWGVHAIGALSSAFSGKGIGVAILDTGMYLAHPDFAARNIVSKSFISGESEEDQHGHGTHCAGIAIGGENKDSGIRYGAAKDADLYVGKVLSNSGVGSDSGILAGMDWAIGNGCQVISMSLGASVREGEGYSNIYNDLAKKSMEMGTLIIAAAGNDSRRSQGIIRPVNHPANCPNILAVGALNKKSGVADFSCGGLNPDGGQVDIAAPGVDIYSTWREPHQYAIISGTSMATPFVAGIAALLWEAQPDAKADEIWKKLTQEARKLSHPVRDVGAGLVQAPR